MDDRQDSGEIKALKVKQRDATHPAVPDVPELTSSVTITVQDYIAAVEKHGRMPYQWLQAARNYLGHEASIASSNQQHLRLIQPWLRLCLTKTVR